MFKNLNMKLISIAIACLLTLNSFSQIQPTVNIVFQDINSTTRNYQVLLDKTSYYSTRDYTTSSGQNTVIISNIRTGTHSLKVYSVNSTNVKSRKPAKKIALISKSFALRDGHNMTISIDVNGHVQFIESFLPEFQESTSTVPMNNNEFNQLLQSVRGKWSQALKGETISEAFNNQRNHFTTSQIKQLLNTISLENDKVDLAKLAYRSVTDSVNFLQINDLFKTQASRNDLNEFLRAKGWTINDGQPLIKSPMVETKFNQLLQSVRSKFSQALKGETESEAFTKPNTYFSVNQIKQLLTLINTENDRFDLAKLSYETVTDSANFLQLSDLFKTQAVQNDFNDFLHSKGWETSNSYNTRRTPMADSKFNALLQNVRSKWSEALKGETESEAFKNQSNYFSTAQIRQLLPLINSESDRLDLAKLSYRSVTDSAKFIQLADLFQVQGNRDEFNNFLRMKGWTINTNQPSVKTPMAESDFQQLVSNVRGNLVQFLKVNYETDIFNNPGYYFTTAQVKTLLLLINSETNRLQLAKLAFRTVTDRANFSQVNDVFSSQGSRNELGNYVRSYDPAQ